MSEPPDPRLNFQTQDGRPIPIDRITWMRQRRADGPAEVRLQGGQVIHVSSEDLDRITAIMESGALPAPSIIGAPFSLSIDTQYLVALGDIGDGPLRSQLSDRLEASGFGVCTGADSAPFPRELHIEFDVASQALDLNQIASIMGDLVPRVPYTIRVTPNKPRN